MDKASGDEHLGGQSSRRQHPGGQSTRRQHPEGTPRTYSSDPEVQDTPPGSGQDVLSWTHIPAGCQLIPLAAPLKAVISL